MGLMKVSKRKLSSDTAEMLLVLVSHKAAYGLGSQSVLEGVADS